MKRREFIKKGLAAGLIGSSAGFSLLGLFVTDGNKWYFRPPGAGAEKDFLSACIRCGKCVQACPYDALKTAATTAGRYSGAPYLEFRDVPCYMCEDLPCVKACPTEALDHSLTNAHEMCLGTAAITDREACLSLNGLRCEICYRVCPEIDKAITLTKHEQSITKRHTVFEPVVHKDKCTGCGICEHACPLSEPAITVVPAQRGEKTGHYIYLKDQQGT